MQTFATEAEFSEAIRGTLEDIDIAPEWREALTAGIGQGEVESRTTAEADGTLNLRIGGWVLREQDIPVTEIIGIVGVAATATVGAGVIAAGAVITALTAFATLTWKTWRRGAKLSKAEIAVLGFLEVHGPTSTAELKAKATSALSDLSAADIDRALKSLRDVELRDGNIVELIRQDASGLWRSRP